MLDLGGAAGSMTSGPPWCAPPWPSDMGRLVPPAALPPWWEEERQGGAPLCEVHAMYVRSHFGTERWTSALVQI